MNRLIIILILLSGFGVASDIYINTAEAGKINKILKSAIRFHAEKLKDIEDRFHLIDISEGAIRFAKNKIEKQKAREIKNKEVCKKESNQFATIIKQTNPIYKKPDNATEIIGEYIEGEIICIRAKLGNFGLTAFGWIEDKNYTPLNK
jgi:hypothetical protein